MLNILKIESVPCHGKVALVTFNFTKGFVLNRKSNINQAAVQYTWLVRLLLLPLYYLNYGSS